MNQRKRNLLQRIKFCKKGQDHGVPPSILIRERGEGGGWGKCGLKGETHRFSIVSPEPCVLETQPIHVSCQSHDEIAGGQRIGQGVRGNQWAGERDSSPSISSFLPIVLLHCFPALAILRNRLSPSTEIGRAHV